jgi:hypothetical protein
LPDEHHVLRMCKKSAVHAGTRKPLPTAFAIGQRPDGSYAEDYISVYWLQKIREEATVGKEQVAAFREYLEHPPAKMLTPKKSWAYAVVPVKAIHAARLKNVDSMTLECRHEPEVEQDAHSGIHPSSPAKGWPEELDSPESLAVRLYLWEQMIHWEDAYATA